MTEPVDLGARCRAHDLEVFLPNCPACLSLTTEYAHLNITQEPLHAP